MPQITITERGWPAHFICAERCRFRRNTLVECGRRRFVVSTVGDMRDDQNREQPVGAGYYYETKVFRARRAGVYWDANTSKQIDGSCLPGKMHYNSDLKANAIHDKTVAELVAKLKRGVSLTES